MTKKTLPTVQVTLDRIIGGGQAIGTLESGKKCLVWGGLPGETVTVQLTKKKSHLVEGVVTEVIKASKERIEPRDPESYLSTSPWQIMDFAAENHYKSALIEEAFELHDIVLPAPITVWSDGRQYEYRNKVEYSFWYDTERQTLDLAFFRRGSHGKIAVQGTSLAAPAINQLAHNVLSALRRLAVDGRTLKTLLIRSNRAGEVAWQLYVKDEDFDHEILVEQLDDLAQSGEIIYSNPKSPASVITKRLYAGPNIVLEDTILDVPFRYATEGFFQINLPVYEQALRDMREWVTSSTPLPSSQIPLESARRSLATGPASESAPSFEKSEILSKAGASPLAVTRAHAIPEAVGDTTKRVVRESEQQDKIVADFLQVLNHSDGAREAAMLREDSRGISNDASGVKTPIIDLYSGVGTIGLTIGGDNVTLIEVNEHAVREMEQNIVKLGRVATARPILAASEKALDYLSSDAIIIVDPPRAGLHEDVIDRLLETAPQRIIYLSCNPVTQARDVALLADKYGIRHHQGYNFFPRTPHIEHLVILDRVK